MSESKKRALILGIGGQDGSYLADLLLERGYRVHGLYRHSSADNLWRLRHLVEPDGSYRVKLWQGDVTDFRSLQQVVMYSNPDEIYNMADQDSVTWSYHIPRVSMDVTYGGVHNLLEVVRVVNMDLVVGKSIRVFQPVSATMFGDAGSPQNELTPLNPLSPYACAKAAAYHLCRYYRQVHGLFVSCGIMYNHDSPRRKPDYLCQKIARGAFDCYRDPTKRLALGPLDVRVDVGWAPDYMVAAYKMLQHDRPDDYVVSSGFAHLIRDVCNTAFGYFGLDYREFVVADEGFNRPDRGKIVGNPEHIRKVLNWEPRFTAVNVVHKLCEFLRETSEVETKTV